MVLLLLFALLLPPAPNTPSEWSRPAEPHKIAGNVYYVGTEDLACYLITGSEGHILINTGLADSLPLITSGIQRLGFRPEDVKILLTNQAHFDHAAALAAFQKLSGAKMYATPPDARLLEYGGAFKPGAPPLFAGFDPIKADRLLQDGEIIRLGPIALKVHHHYGHTPGSASYEMDVTESGRKLNLLFVNMGTVVMPFDSPDYPNMAADFERTFERQLRLRPDIWLATHASQSNHAEKRKRGTFLDPEGYLPAVEKYKKAYLEKLRAR